MIPIDKIKKLLKDTCRDIPYSTHHEDHIMRVVNMSLFIGRELGADLNILHAAALLHDIGRFDEKKQQRCHADISSEIARNFLTDLNCSDGEINAVCHAIEVHRFRSKINPESLEAEILQDADNLDALGAIGVSRIVSYNPELPFYSEMDPLCEYREPDDQRYTLDHFFIKILKLKDKMNTLPAKHIAEHRHKFVLQFIQELKMEIFLDTTG